MKFFKKSASALLLLVLLVIACLSSLPVATSEAETQKRVAYYTAKNYFWIIPVFTAKNSVKWQEYDFGNHQMITITGQVTKDTEISVFLSFDKETSQETSRIVIESGQKLNEIDFQGIITAIQYLRTTPLFVGREEELKVFTENETLKLFLKIKETKSMVIANTVCVVYITNVNLISTKGPPTNIVLWFIKGGELDGYIAKFKFGRLELTLNKVS